MGTTATNMWLQDPIPSMRLREGTMNGAVHNVASAGKSNVGSSTMVIWMVVSMRCTVKLVLSKQVSLFLN